MFVESRVLIHDNALNHDKKRSNCDIEFYVSCTKFYLVSSSILLYNLSSSKTFSKDFTLLIQNWGMCAKYTQPVDWQIQSVNWLCAYAQYWLFFKLEIQIFKHSVDWPKLPVDWICSNSHILNRHHVPPKSYDPSSMEMTTPLRCNFSVRVTTLLYYTYPTPNTNQITNSNLFYIISNFDYLLLA